MKSKKDSKISFINDNKLVWKFRMFTFLQETEIGVLFGHSLKKKTWVLGIGAVTLCTISSRKYNTSMLYFFWFLKNFWKKKIISDTRGINIIFCIFIFLWDEIINRYILEGLHVETSVKIPNWGFDLNLIIESAQEDRVYILDDESATTISSYEFQLGPLPIQLSNIVISFLVSIELNFNSVIWLFFVKANCPHYSSQNAI